MRRRLFRLPRPAGEQARLDVEEEIRFHLDMRARELEAQGVDPEAARAEALRAFGDLDRARRRLRDGAEVRERRARARRWVEDLAQDARYALRGLLRNPAYAAVSVLTLALGIGANTAIFSLVDGVLLRPLAYPAPERVVVLYEQDRAGGRRLASYPVFDEWRRESRSFDALAFAWGETVILKDAEGAKRLTGAYASPALFRVLGTKPLLGRTFTGSPEDASGVVLSYQLWTQEFGGDPGVLGRSVTLGERSATVLGVMPRAFSYPDWAGLWLPLDALPPTTPVLARRDLHVDSRIVARLAPGVDLPRARAEMNTIARRIAAADPGESALWTRVELAPLRDEVLGGVGDRLRILALAVGLVLLIACANVASLSLARAGARSGELAVRRALGAGRGRLARQLLAESGVVALAGGAAGLALAFLAVRALHAARPAWLPRIDEVSVDGRVLAFTLAASLLSALLFGAAPALFAASHRLAAALRSGTQGAGRDNRPGRRLRAALVTLEVALAIVLLAGAGLLIRSFARLQAEERGFQMERLVALRVFPPLPRYAEPAARLELFRRLREAAAAVPGVESAALVNHLPIGGAWLPTRVLVPGRAPREQEDLALYRTAAPGYFATARIPIRRGRDFTAADLSRAARAVIVNEALARTYFPGQDPIGRSFTVFDMAQGDPGFGQPLVVTVVGVAGDTRSLGLDQPPVPEVFLPYTATPWPNMYLVVRTRLAAGAVRGELARAVRDVDADIPVAGPEFSAQFHEVEEYASRELAPRTFSTGVLAAFAAAALLLAATGTYGIAAYLVQQRRRELGLRVALGAEPGSVLRLVLRQGMRLVLLGVALGLGGALLGTRLLSTLLFDVGATDPLTLLAVAGVLTGVALLACYIPSRRALRIEPMKVLKAE